MRLVERMTLSPATCVVCGSGNIPDKNGEIGPFLDIERDIDWGDSVYFCPICVMKVAETTGYASPDEVADLKRQIRNLEKELHDAQSEVEQRTLRAEKAEKKMKVMATADSIRKREHSAA